MISPLCWLPARFPARTSLPPGRGYHRMFHRQRPHCSMSLAPPVTMVKNLEPIWSQNLQNGAGRTRSELHPLASKNVLLVKLAHLQEVKKVKGGELSQKIYKFGSGVPRVHLLLPETKFFHTKSTAKDEATERTDDHVDSGAKRTARVKCHPTLTACLQIDIVKL